MGSLENTMEFLFIIAYLDAQGRVVRHFARGGGLVSEAKGRWCIMEAGTKRKVQGAERQMPAAWV